MTIDGLATKPCRGGLVRIAEALISTPDVLRLTTSLIVADIQERFHCSAATAHRAVEIARGVRTA